MDIDLNALVDTYNIDNIYEEYKRAEFISKLNNYLDFRKASVMELGSASGRLTLMLSKIAREVVAVDGSNRFLDIAKKTVGRAENVSFLLSYFEEMDIAKTFDCIVLHHVLEHISNPKEILTKIKKFLNVGGVLAISVPNAHSLSRQLAVKMGLLDSVYDLTQNDLCHGHLRVYNWDIMEEEIVLSGFKVVGRHGLSFKLLSDKQNIEMLSAGIIGNEQIKGLWSIGDEYCKLSGAIMVVAKRK